MPNRILFDKDLSDKEKLLFCLISSLCAEKWYCRANNWYLGEKLDITWPRVSWRISSLEKKWYITVTIDQKWGNKRNIAIAENSNTSFQKQQDPIAENSKTPLAENGKHNNTILNKQNKNIKEKESIVFPEEFSEKEKELFTEYISMRKKIKKPTTLRSQELLCKKLQELWKTETERIQVIEQAIMWSRQSFYPLKNTNDYWWKEKLQWRVSTEWYADAIVYGDERDWK